MKSFVPQVLRFESLPSTNLEAARRANQDAAEGLCVVAGEQTAGRGRLQRYWISPKNAGLYCSIILRPEFPQSLWPLITLMAAVAVHEALKKACALETDIKWPNDILATNKKVCGILAETIETPTGRAIVLGIGINLAKSSFPEDLKAEATSVEDVTGHKPQSEIVLTALIESLAMYYEMLKNPAGSEAILREWCARSSYADGKQIRVVESNESFIGTTCGLEPDGALRVETLAGEIRVVRAGDVTSVRPG